jgi:hypothetical protein
MRTATLFLALAALNTFAADFATQAVEATHKLYNKDSTATGTLILPPPELNQPGKLIIATADHVFSKMSGDKMLLVLRVRKADGSYERKDVPITIRDADKKPLWVKHPQHDAAAILIDRPEVGVYTPLPFECLATEDTLTELKIHVASPLYILGFPTQVEANSAGFPIARHGSIASFPITPIAQNKTFYVDFTTFAGDSGGPVFVSNTRLKEAADSAPPIILGIVLSLTRHDEEVKSMFEERKIHYPLGLGTILHATFVRETIMMLKK